MAKSNAGRPTVMTDEVVAKLEEGFELGFNKTEACLHAGIARSVLYDYIDATKGYSDRIDVLRTRPSMKAKRVISGAMDQGDAQTARWLLEKTNKDYNPKTQLDHTTSDGSMKPTTIEIVGVKSE
ncbi:hypothetical protein [uncultured Paraglaciecola sp.]|uniref:hypothetical protein n=1 Tax=uncultured Paraglaciecola sp. TaxID=1765024 RepID=UPI0026125B74|nr:hypothetical protein [uncultured Paraglaciecola sp.]